ncbi:MAG TPA: (4Fe-4S)-binding protein [Gemmatimonadaceae bacterium]|nr:(4Fe-4S)-binding protein [Gemmatimonadaceae bacterium]
MTTRDDGPEELHEYGAGPLTVEWRPGRCQHSGVCVRSLPLVFDPRRRPWIDGSAADPERIAETVARCPSGALQLRR